jgi:5-methylcytosine-specific restriction enzyme subunit McrC
MEILPKIDVPATETAGGMSDIETRQSRRNLLYMLEVAGDVPLRSRDVAQLMTRRAPLSDTLAGIFARRLLAELLRGPERTYAREEQNLRTVKGKLILGDHLLRNAAHRERFFCGYDDLTANSPMNQVFKAACRMLLDATYTPATQDDLRHCLLLLESVDDVTELQDLAAHVVIHRQNERFADLYSFCRLILSRLSPTVEGGGTRSFSLLFDMNKVFERFVAGFLRRHVIPMLRGFQLYEQAKTKRRHLMTTGSRSVLSLEPDLLIRHPDGRLLVADTKWKRVSGSQEAGTEVAREDLYQLYAYVQRYECESSILLYPQMAGSTEQEFQLLEGVNSPSQRRVAVRYVNLYRDLHLSKERDGLKDELHALVVNGFALRDPCGSSVSAG